MKSKWGWPVLLGAQAAAGAALTGAGLVGALAFPSPVSIWATDLLMWGLLPLFGAISAYRITRKGVSNYAAWFLPAATQTAACWAVVGYPPSSVGMPFLTAGVSLVAAAAAQTVNERETRHTR